MGNFKSLSVNLDKLSQVNLVWTWKKYCKTDEITQTEFMPFIYSLGSALGIKIEEADIGGLFNYLQRAGTITYLKFMSEFDAWTDEKMQEESGTEVLKPNVSLGVVTKSYELAVPADTIVYKKLLIKNPEDYVKNLKVSSNNTNVLQIRTAQVKINPGQQEYIKFKIKAEEDCEAFIVVSHFMSEMMEETLSVKIKVGERPRTPVRQNSGSLSKNKAWKFYPSRPSPKRNQSD
jgi:hypothetical protein